MNQYLTILSKVSRKKPLFKKELKRSLKRMDDHERFECYKWCRNKFYHLHPDVLEEVFKDIFKAITFA
jgi:hypothetical protein